MREELTFSQSNSIMIRCLPSGWAKKVFQKCVEPYNHISRLNEKKFYEEHLPWAVGLYAG